jgi:hypothetical protein
MFETCYTFHGSECVAFTEVSVKRTHFKSVELQEKLATTQPIASAQSVMASHCTDFGTGVQLLNFNMTNGSCWLHILHDKPFGLSAKQNYLEISTVESNHRPTRYCGRGAITINGMQMALTLTAMSWVSQLFGTSQDKLT